MEAAREKRRGLPAGDQDAQEMTHSRPGIGQGHRLPARQGGGGAHPHLTPDPPLLMPPASEVRRSSDYPDSAEQGSLSCDIPL